MLNSKACFLIIFLISSSFSNTTWIRPKGLHDPLPDSIQSFLASNGFSKWTWYYDSTIHKSGEFQLYPYYQLLPTLYLIETPKIQSKEEEYTFLLAIQVSPRIVILDTLGPFYDEFPTDVNLADGHLTIKLWSEPAPGEQPYSFIYYDFIKNKFIRKKGRQ